MAELKETKGKGWTRFMKPGLPSVKQFKAGGHSRTFANFPRSCDKVFGGLRTIS